MGSEASCFYTISVPSGHAYIIPFLKSLRASSVSNFNPLYSIKATPSNLCETGSLYLGFRVRCYGTMPLRFSGVLLSSKENPRGMHLKFLEALSSSWQHLGFDSCQQSPGSDSIFLFHHMQLRETNWYLAIFCLQISLAILTSS